MIESFLRLPSARALIAVALLQGTPVLDAAEKKRFDEGVARKFADVAEWRGFFELDWSGSAGRSDGGSSSTGTADTRSSGTIRLRAVTRPDGSGSYSKPGDGVFYWKGTAEATFAGQASYSSRDRNGEATDWSAEASGRAELSSTQLTLWMESSLATFHWGAGPNDTVNVRRTGHQVVRGSGRELVRQEIDERSSMSVYWPNHHQMDLGNERRNVDWWPQMAEGPGVISVNNSIMESGSLGLAWFALPMRSRVVLFPVYDDVEVEVTIPGYADWLPKGNLADPRQAGNALAVRAVLKSKTGKTAQLPDVESFRFELVDTSREPGVCMNWPLGAKDREPDLRLADLSSAESGRQMEAAQRFFAQWGLTSAGDYDLASLPPGGFPPMSFGAVTEDGQKAELHAPPKDKAGQPFAEAAIECFDFGAKAELRVTCILADGREIIGLLKTEGGGQDLVRLPKRAPADWIAEKWRADRQAGNLSASDDNEKVEGQPMNGDGFTLYEEYRGWAVGGRHRQGDPKRKDFFVLNQRGADFRGGISLFERISQLRVHSTLRDGIEMSADERCMNRNHRDAPHRVDQHGVILAKDNGPEGGMTVGIDGADRTRAFRPRYVKTIYLERSEAGHGRSAFSPVQGVNYNLSPRDADMAWDRGVAHELLHAVGVDHHGEAQRQKVCCYFQSANAPLNPSGGHRFVSKYSLSPDFYSRDGSHPFAEEWSDDRGPVITLQWEDSRRDVFEDYLEQYQRQIELYRSTAGTESSQKHYRELAAKLAYTGKSAEWWSNYMDEVSAGYGATRVIWVGPRNGTDSGNDQCVMKYYFANAYQMEGKENAYYLIRPGQLQAGRQICRSPAGTGANASGHKPQSRFGDSLGGRGDCFGQICPNDAIPPRIVTGNRP